MKKKNTTLDRLNNAQIAAAIDLYVRGERDRAMLKRRLIDGICYEPLAEEFQISVEQAKRIIYKAQDRLFRFI